MKISLNCNKKNSLSLIQCIEILGKSTTDISPCIDKSSMKLVKSLLNSLENEAECILFYALQTFINNKDYEKQKYLKNKNIFTDEFLSYFKELLMQNVDMDSICSHKSYDIGKTLYLTLTIFEDPKIIVKYVKLSVKHLLVTDINEKSYYDKEDLNEDEQMETETETVSSFKNLWDTITSFNKILNYLNSDESLWSCAMSRIY